MNYRIEKKDSFRIVGAKEHYTLNVEENFAQIPSFWQKTVQSGIFTQILGLLNQKPKGVLGIISSMKGKDFDYYIAAPSDKAVPEGCMNILSRLAHGQFLLASARCQRLYKPCKNV